MTGLTVTARYDAVAGLMIMHLVGSSVICQGKSSVSVCLIAE